MEFPAFLDSGFALTRAPEWRRWVFQQPAKGVRQADRRWACLVRGVVVRTPISRWS